MRENERQARILLGVGSVPGCRLFRNHVGEGWHGHVEKEWTEHGVKFVLLREPRRVTFGLAPNSPDIVGWRSVVVTPAMVGLTVALFSALEIKTDSGRASKGQQRFLDVVGEAGGLAGVARDVADARKVLVINDTS